MKWGEANALRLCLCCGNPGALLLRLPDGRAIRSCSDCQSRCAFCQDNWGNGKPREPIGREAEWEPAA